MIKLTMEPKKINDILDIYEKIDIPAKSRGRKPKSIIAILKDRMDAKINVGTCDSDQIVQAFLKEFFVLQTNGTTRVDEQKIRDYLCTKELTEIILKFWKCVTEVWIRKIKTDTAVIQEQKDRIENISANDKKEIITALSKWNGMIPHIGNLVDKWVTKNQPQQQNMEALKCIREIITLDTLPFFDDFELSSLKSNDPNAIGMLNNILDQLTKDKDRLTKVKLRYHDSVFHNKNGKVSATDILSDIFDYDLLKDKMRNKVLSILYVPVCPYCNRQYITKYDYEEEKKVTADLDHYFYKAVYPYLALCVYNFVPSCQICNSRTKHTADFYAPGHLYPYSQESNSEMKFKLDNPDLLWSINKWKDADVENDLVIDIVPGPNTALVPERRDAVINSVESLRLKEIYESHKDYVCDLMCDVLVYSDRMAKELYDDFTIKVDINGLKVPIKLFDNEEQIKEMVFGQPLKEEELHKRPLAKLTYDLLEDLLPKKKVNSKQ